MKQIKTINFIVGSSGCGKNEVLSILTKKIDQAKFVKSYTTRLPRPDEKMDIHYYFVDDKKFKELKPLLIESNTFEGISYGHTIEEITNYIDNNNHFFFTIEPNGLYQILKWFKENPMGKDLSNKYDFNFTIMHIKTKKSIRLKRLLLSVSKYLPYEDDFILCNNIIKRIQRDDDNIDSTLDYLTDNGYLKIEPNLKYLKVINNDTIITLTTKYLTETIEKSKDINYFNGIHK